VIAPPNEANNDETISIGAQSYRGTVGKRFFSKCDLSVIFHFAAMAAIFQLELNFADCFAEDSRLF
jgi:hypothetical protein